VFANPQAVSGVAHVAPASQDGSSLPGLPLHFNRQESIFYPIVVFLIPELDQ